MDFDINKFGERLRKARVACGKSQAALGSSAGLSAQAISAYEKGKQKPSIDAAAILADTLGVSLDDLCGIEMKHSKEANSMIPAKNGFELTNYADVVEHLAALSRFFRCSCGTKVFELPQEGWEYEPDGSLSTTYNRAAFYISSPHLAHFIQQWGKMYQLYSDGTIQIDLFTTWYTGMLSELAKIQLQERHHSECTFEVPLFGFDNDAGDIQGN